MIFYNNGEQSPIQRSPSRVQNPDKGGQPSAEDAAKAELPRVHHPGNLALIVSHPKPPLILKDIPPYDER